ncbi:hypothetical protein GPX89_26795 [Nocardia sp. ET3-3]|uniref:Nucleotidyltransferase n=1 Tax=Nocardia terrae TaxID=2675851 RepID=A0A7K1V325_9NOCA|nr:nucleotidyltransferase [Nocardia terrae]MVU80849.1 hypothetical protein [Nocardia terrae]
MPEDPLGAFVDTLVTPSPDRQLVADRRALIDRLLKSAGVWMTFESGSFTHGTAIPGHSDVDLMGRISAAERPVSPSWALTKAKNALAVESWRFRELKVGSPAVKIQFSTGPHFEVAPAYYSSRKGSDDVFVIPGPNEEWVESVPAAHNRYVSAQNDRLGKKVKPLVRLLKAWKYHNGVPISSTYLELRAAQHAAGESSIYYDIDMRVVLLKMISSNLAAMNDPIGIVTRIRPCSSEQNRLTALAAIRRAHAALERAYVAKKTRDASEYWKSMYTLFGAAFPYPSW